MPPDNRRHFFFTLRDRDILCGGFSPAPRDKEQKPESDDPATNNNSTLKRKVINDASAYIKALAERNGRNGEWAVKAVREAVSLTASEALKMHVIDFVAADLPGVAGGISLLLAFYAFQIPPLNDSGLALMILGLGLLISEAFIPSFGSLGIGGIVSFAIGSLILMDDASLQISIPLIIGTTADSAVFLLLLAGRVLFMGKKRPGPARKRLSVWSVTPPRTF